MIEKTDSVVTESSSGDLAWTKLLDTPTNLQNGGGPIIIQMETPNGSFCTPTEGVQLKKSESWIGSFHKQLQKSMKAVTDSPGPISR